MKRHSKGSRLATNIPTIYLVDLQSVAIKLSRSENLPALGQVVTAVMKLADDPSGSPKALERVLEKDAGLTAKLLRVANSSYYGNNQVPSVGRAISVLGINTVKSLVLALSMQSLSNGATQIWGFDKVAYWRHTLATATAARILGKLLMPMRAEELYSAGMMHDIGLLVMERYMPSVLEESIIVSVEEKIVQHVAERKLYGFDHAEVGALLAEKWGLSESLQNAIRYHHNLMEAPADCKTTHIVSVANVLAHQCEFSTFPASAEHKRELDPMSLMTVDLPHEQLEIIRSVVIQEVLRAQESLIDKAA